MNNTEHTNSRISFIEKNDGACTCYIGLNSVWPDNAPKTCVCSDHEIFCCCKCEGCCCMTYNLRKAPQSMSEMRDVACKIVSELRRYEIKSCAIEMNASDEEMVNLAYAVYLASWKFDRYTSSKKASLAEVRILVADQKLAEGRFEELKNLADAISEARDMVTEPGNTMNSSAMAERARDLEKLGVSVDILDERKMTELGMDLLLGVNSGSANPPYLAVMHWKRKETVNPIAIVGKGVTFDSGGLSIKTPSQHMLDMKKDMAGGAATIGLMKAIATNKLPVNVVALVPIVENMTGSKAQRTGDIVRSMSGKTVEIHNTDAEGRLILADAVHYACAKLNPSCVITVATLTGAVIVSLGSVYAGLFSDCQNLANDLMSAGKEAGEELWQLPLHPKFREALKGNISDLKNLTASGVGAGSSTAAEFVHEFVSENTPFAHLDIAGVSGDAMIGTGFGVALLYKWLKSHNEECYEINH